MKNEDKIRKWLNGELSGSELQEFEATKDFAEITKLMDAVKNFKAPEYDAEKEYRTQKTISLFQQIRPVIQVAAVFVVILAISYFFYNQLDKTTTKSNWIAEQPEVYLPDSSVVLLNADSKIRYSNKDWERGRGVELKGEAFFRVKKGSQFNVITDHGTVSVLGTEFGIKDRKDYYEVICYSGSVQVVSDQKTVLLKPQSAFRIINNHEENYEISNKAAPDWLNGESSFNSVPLQYVFEELERQYQVSVETRKINLDQLFTGSFSNQNLEIAMEAITIPVNLSYEINEKKIVLTLDEK